MISTLKFEMDQDHLQLLKITLKALCEYSEFDSFKVYENGNSFEVITTNIEQKFVTRTNICKFRWRVVSSYCKKPGYDEIEIIRKKK